MARPSSRSSSPSRRVLHLISQAHIDPVWLWPWSDGAAEVLTTVQSAVDRAAENPGFKFTRASAATYRWLQEMDPRLFAAVKRLIRAGRWEVVGGWIEQPDCNLPSTESFVRQSLLGKAWSRRHLGVDVDIGYNVDSFGHAGGLPQLLKRAGFNRYVFMRPDKSEAPKVPDLFWWEGDGGSRILTQRVPEQYSQSPRYTGDDLERLLRDTHERHFSPGFDHGLFFFGVGNHGGGPTREHIARVLALNGDPDLPELRFSTLAGYFAAVEASPAFRALPVVRGDLQYHARGCYSATGEVKHLNRRAEKTLVAAEALRVAADLSGPARRAARPSLHEAWWRVLFNQFHDVLAGSCVASTWPAVRDAVGGACAEADEDAVRSALQIARRVDTRGEPGGVLFVWNPLPWARRVTVQTDTFSDPHGRDPITHLQTREGTPVPVQWMNAEAHFGPWLLPWKKLTAVVDLPPLGYRVLRFATGAAPTPAPAPPPPFRLSTEVAGLESWTTKKGVEILSAPLGLVVVEDESDTWAHGVDSFEKELGRPVLVESVVVETGPLRTVHRQKATWGRSDIWVDFIHDVATDSVRLHFRINWQERRQILKLDLPTALAKPRVHCRCAGGVSTRRFSGDEQPMQDWVALTGRLGSVGHTVALLNQSSYSFSCTEGRLRVVLARSTPYAEFAIAVDDKQGAWVDGLRKPGQRAVIGCRAPDDSPEPFTDQGWQERHFALVEHAGSGPAALGRLDREAESFQSRPLVFVDSAHPGELPWEGGFLSVAPDHLAVPAVKPAEDGDGFIVRLQEMSGRATTGVLRVHGGGDDLPVTLAAWEIQTLRLRPARRGWTAEPCTLLEGPIDPKASQPAP